MWQDGWRDLAWNQLDQPWDILSIGGGITGAGLLPRWDDVRAFYNELNEANGA